MNAPVTLRPRPRRMRAQRGFVLVTGLLFLVVITMLAIALFRSSGLMERLSANSRDKQRAFESSQAALQYAEWFLGNGTANTKNSCSATTGKIVSGIFVCTEPLDPSRDTLAQMAWAPNAFAYTLPTMNVQAGGGVIPGGADINYQAPPGVYIEDMGLMSDGKSELYQVTAYGYGGSADTLSIVRSTYKVTSTTPCLSCTP